MVSLERKNGGFTLVELLVSVSILSVIGLAIGGFIYVSTNQYRAANAEVDVQAEAQVVQGQLTNLVLGASRGMDAKENELTLFDYDPETKKKSCIRIHFSEGDSRLLYTGYILKEDGADAGTWKAEEGKEDLFYAQYVTGFSVEFCDENGGKLTEDVKKIGQVVICIDYEQNGREYRSKFTVCPRNPVIASDDVALLYEGVE